MQSVFLCGKDKRFIECQKHLKKNKINSFIVENIKDLEHCGEPKIIVLPFMGFEETNIFYDYIFSTYHNAIFIVYNETNVIKKMIEDNKIKSLNLNDITIFSKTNNIATAESTLLYIIKNLAINFDELNVALLGYGKCGKEVFDLYQKLNMKVDVYVRRNEVKESLKENGFLLTSLEKNIKKYDLIVNTIPSNVISDSLLHNISLNTLLFDLSSYPYGYNHEIAKYLGINSMLLKGLPSLHRYKTMGKLLARVIKECLKI